MKDKINITELLKDCPKGMELDCTMYDSVTLLSVDDREDICFPIRVIREDGNSMALTKYGQYTDANFAKCVIFPKGKTTWEGFVPPCKFNAGDVLVSETGNIVLFSHIDSKGVVHYHCIIPNWGSFRIEENTSIGVGRYYDCILANEEQRQRMYDKIKCSGYKYNQQLNKLEKLVKPKFKVGNKIKRKGDTRLTTIKDIRDNYYIITTPNFFGNAYITDKLLFSNQNEYELVPNKFDITTLKPFDKVLVRDKDTQKWCISFFSHCNGLEFYKYSCVNGSGYAYCIPYEGNEHLLGTTIDCDDFYKTWE